MINTVQLSDLILCIIVEKVDSALTSFYLQKFYTHTNLKPDNIKILSQTKIPQSLKEFDIIIFDIDIPNKNFLNLINKISYDGDIVIFTSQDLEAEVRSQLEDKVTDIVVKPHSPSRDRCAIDWESLKDKPYFTST